MAVAWACGKVSEVMIEFVSSCESASNDPCEPFGPGLIFEYLLFSVIGPLLPPVMVNDIPDDLQSLCWILFSEINGRYNRSHCVDLTRTSENCILD